MAAALRQPGVLCMVFLEFNVLPIYRFPVVTTRHRAPREHEMRCEDDGIREHARVNWVVVAQWRCERRPSRGIYRTGKGKGRL